MILFYNWSKIKKHSERRVQVIRTIFESMLQTSRPAVGRKKYDSMDFSGDSYLLRPDRLLRAFQTGNQVDAATVLMLASYRNYAEYCITGDCSLPTKLVNIPIDTLKQNSLLKIAGTDIHFLTEI